MTIAPALLREYSAMNEAQRAVVAHAEGRGVLNGAALQNLARYVDGCIVELGRNYGVPHPLAGALQEFVAGIGSLRQGQSLALRPADYFYRLLADEPFAGFVKNENRARNLAILSQLLNTFQNYYHCLCSRIPQTV